MLCDREGKRGRDARAACEHGFGCPAMQIRMRGEPQGLDSVPREGEYCEA